MPGLWVVFVGLFLLPVDTPSQSSPVVRKVEVHGTRRPLALETRAGETLALSRIERDVRRLWATGWFDDIEVATEERGSEVDVAFELKERPRLYLGRVVFEPKDHERSVHLTPGTRIDPVLARKVAGHLRRQLIEEGYADAGHLG